MKKIILLLLLIHLKCIGQTPNNIFVYDLFSKKPVSFATILFFDEQKKQNGMYADENGFAKIKILENTILEISCLGYETKKISNYNEIKDTIYLNPNSTILDEVIVTDKQSIKNLGFNKEKKNESINTFKGSEIVVYINNLEKIDTKIKSILLDVKKRKDFTVALKIKFYKKSDYNKPSELINSLDIIHYIKGKIKGTIEVDVSDFNIDFPKEGAFVGVECLGFMDKDGNFIDDLDKWKDFRFFLVDTQENLTFVRNSFKTNIWYNNLKPRLEEIGIKYKNFPNASFGIKVY